MKCIYCNSETDLTVSDIIPYALTGAKLKKRFVCKTHNAFTNDNYEKWMIAQLDIFRNRLGLTERDGDPVRYHAELNIGEYKIPNTSISDHASILANSDRLFKTTDENGKKVLIGDRSRLSKISGATEDRIQDISSTDVSIVSRSDLRTLFISDNVLHTVAKIAYEWHCYINDIEFFDEKNYDDIVSYILSPESIDHPVEIVVDAQVWNLMDHFSRTGSHMLFEYYDIDGNLYVIFGFWGVIIYKIRVRKNRSANLNNINCYNTYFYHIDGTNSGTIFGTYGKPTIISENCVSALLSLSEEIKNRMSKIGERDISREYIAENIKKITLLLDSYKNGTCTIAQLLDFEHQDRVIPVYIIEQLLINKDQYNFSETFTHNMKQILECKERFIFTKEKQREVIQKYIGMDDKGTFAMMIEDAIIFFESTNLHSSVE